MRRQAILKDVRSLSVDVSGAHVAGTKDPDAPLSVVRPAAPCVTHSHAMLSDTGWDTADVLQLGERQVQVPNAEP